MTHGVPAEHLDEADLMRELAHLHETRHLAFLHASNDALRTATVRTQELEREYLRRHPERDIDPDRTRDGARAREVNAPLG